MRCTVLSSHILCSALTAIISRVSCTRRVSFLGVSLFPRFTPFSELLWNTPEFSFFFIKFYTSNQEPMHIYNNVKCWYKKFGRGCEWRWIQTIQNCWKLDLPISKYFFCCSTTKKTQNNVFLFVCSFLFIVIYDVELTAAECRADQSCLYQFSAWLLGSNRRRQ